MMRKMLSELSIISQLTPQQGRWHFQVEQRAGWAQSCEQGVLIAIVVAAAERSAYWLNRVTLLLVAYEYGLDDALQLWQRQWWLWHRYPLACDRASLEQGLLLQSALASLLTQQPEEQASTAWPRPNNAAAAPTKAPVGAPELWG